MCAFLINWLKVRVWASDVLPGTHMLGEPKFEIRSSKFETNPNTQKGNTSNKGRKSEFAFCFFLDWPFVSDFDFRISSLS